MQVKGKVFKQYQDNGRWSILVGEPDKDGKRQRVTGFGTCPFKEAEDIDIEVIENKGFLNYKQAKDIKDNIDEPELKETADVTRSIARAVAWKCAVKLVVGVVEWETMICLVRKIEKDLLFVGDAV